MKRKLTTKEFINKCRNIHGDTYDYSLVEYQTSHKPVIIICPIHGKFTQTASDHIHHNAGCKQCGKPNVVLTNEEFIKRAKGVHGTKYNYSKVKYTNTDIKVNIICPMHGIFQQTPSGHINRKQGCNKCGNNIPTNEEFITRCKQIHNNRYDYSNVKYKNSLTKIAITCKIHGKFSQLPSNHLNGTGCPQCGCNISKPETAWLNSLNVDRKFRNQWVVIGTKKFNVDAFVPTTNTVYEFWGDFFHGNPKIFTLTDTNPKTKTTYGWLFERTQEKRTAIINAGYNLIEIWEHDWKNV